MSQLLQHLQRFLLSILLVILTSSAVLVTASELDDVESTPPPVQPPQQLQVPSMIQLDNQQAVVRTLGADQFHIVMLNDDRNTGTVIHSPGEDGYATIDVHDFKGEIRVIASKEGFIDSRPTYIYVNKSAPDANKRIGREQRIDRDIARLFATQAQLDLSEAVVGLEGDDARFALEDELAYLEFTVHDLQSGKHKITDYQEELIEKPARHTSTLVKVDEDGNQKSGLLPLTGELKDDLLLMGAVVVAGLGTFSVYRSKKI